MSDISGELGIRCDNPGCGKETTYISGTLVKNWIFLNVSLSTYSNAKYDFCCGKCLEAFAKARQVEEREDNNGNN